jgi:hypothetical protein
MSDIVTYDQHWYRIQSWNRRDLDRQKEINVKRESVVSMSVQGMKSIDRWLNFLEIQWHWERAVQVRKGEDYQNE